MISYKQGLTILIASQVCGVSSSLTVCAKSQAAPGFPLGVSWYMVVAF